MVIAPVAGHYIRVTLQEATQVRVNRSVSDVMCMSEYYLVK